MNILMVNGTMRKSSTYMIGRMLIEKVMKEGDTVKELFLPKDMPEFCRGCGMCFSQSETKCPDYLVYMKRVTELIDAADLLVFTSPVYVYHVTGQLKALLDHYGYRWMVHRPEASMFRKQAVCITTAAGAGMRRTVKDIKDSLSFWGISEIHTYGVAVKSITWEGVAEEIKLQIDTATNQLAEKIKHDPTQVSVSLKTKILFYVMRRVHKKVGLSPTDVAYWQEKGWLENKRPWNHG